MDSSRRVFKRSYRRDVGMSGHIGWIVAGSLATGLIAALLLVAAPFIPPTEAGVTGAFLCGLALGWAMLTVLSVRFTDQPQSWAAVPALFMGLSGLLLIAFGSRIFDVLAWAWPPALLALVIWMLVRVRRQLRSPTRRWSRPSPHIVASPTPGGVLLAASGVSKCYTTEAGRVPALQGIDLTVREGDFVALMGPSGSGKTTMLNCLSGLDDIDEGSVVIDGHDIHRMSDAARTTYRAKKMGFIFQSFNLIPVFTAAENVELPLLLTGERPSIARKRAESTLDRVGLGHRMGHRPNELSGGEQQRVTIARALAGNPAVVWADEPTGNLDSETAASVMELLLELHQDGLTIVLVTHDPSIGASAGRLLMMRDGRIESDSLSVAV